MIRFFKKVQTGKMVKFAPKPTNLAIKEVKTIAQKKRVPRFLSRAIILKLKKKQLIYNTLTKAFTAFTFYQNENKNKQKTIRSSGYAWSSLLSTLKVRDQKNGYNQNINDLKEETARINIVNREPILQKETISIGMRGCTFLKTKPFFNVLQKFTGALLKKNGRLIKETYPLIYASLKSSSTIGGFKKVLYNKALVHDRRLKPGYNRRKHSISYSMVVKNQFARLDKAFVYFGKNKLASIISLVLKAAYPAIPEAFSKAHRKNKNLIRTKAIPTLVSIIEGQVAQLLWRNQFSCLLTKSRQNYRLAPSSFNLICKKSTVIVLKE